MSKQTDVLEQIRGGLIVSCQALPHEPLHGSEIMGRMALAAKLGGAVGIRANTGVDIRAIRAQVNLPIIGIVKREYEESPVYITPTMAEVEEVAESGADILAMDATARPRPGGVDLETLYRQIRSRYPHLLLMADTSCYDEGKAAFELGFDLIGTTLCGYTPYTQGQPLPALGLIAQLSRLPGCRVVAEGGIHYPEQLKQAFASGAYTAVVGGAITRPLEITKRFTSVL